MSNATSSDDELPATTLLERQILAGVLALISISGSVGNTVVILSVLMSYKLRTKMNVFVANLSFADLLVSCNLVWIMVAFVSEDGWPLADELCVLCGFVLITCTGASVFTLMFIAVNRLVLIRYSQAAYRILCRPLVMSAMLAAIWLIPLSVAVVPLVSVFGELGYSSRYRTCLKNHDNEYALQYDILLSLTYYPIPTTLIIISYLKVFLYLRSRNRKLSPESKSCSVAQGSNSGSQQLQLQQQPTNRPTLRERLDKRQVQVTKNMFYVVCIFFICTTPYGLSLLCKHDVCLRITSYAAVLLSANSCINPFIYAHKHPDFRKVILAVLTCRPDKIPQRIKLCGKSN